uniref:Uncharacterized protein n=1 Tax=Arundo donax TaxID=35708 RepID=A0A0A8YDE3_ARUDO
MPSAKHLANLSMSSAARQMPTSIPPAPPRLSATDIAPVFATDTISTFAGRPNPKSTSYTRNLGDPATDSGRSTLYASMTRSIHNFPFQYPDPPRAASSMPAATAAHAAKIPSATSFLGAEAKQGPTQLPRYFSGTGGSKRGRWSMGKLK